MGSRDYDTERMKTLLDRWQVQIGKPAHSAGPSVPPPSFGPRKVRSWRAWSVCAGAALLLGFAARAQQSQRDAGSKEPVERTSPPLLDVGPVPPIVEPGAEEAKTRGKKKIIKAGQPRPGAADVDADESHDEALAHAMPETDEEDLDGGVGPGAPSVLSAIPATAPNAVVQTAPVPGLGLLRDARIEREDSGPVMVAPTADGKTARLSINPALQAQMQKLFEIYHPMSGAMVAIEPKTGRVLALVEYSADGHSEGAATRPLYPAASVFKIITGAALLEKGISPNAETCYHGGMHAIVGKLLQDKPRLDRNCVSLSMALAKSANVVFAKMAEKHLDSNALRVEAEKFLFNRQVWADPAVSASIANIPDSGLEFAKSAAGFGDVRLSPLHAALIAAAVGNGGDMQDPTLIDSVDGVPAKAQGGRRILRSETANELKEMMKLTVSEGTASHSFHERKGASLGSIEVAGKTGSLSNHQNPFKDYSWFVGFAPADDPKIAVAAVVVNGLKWSIHAPYVAREALHEYLVGGALGTPPAAHRARPAKHKAKKKHK